jgi:protein SCO1/2
MNGNGWKELLVMIGCALLAPALPAPGGTRSPGDLVRGIVYEQHLGQPVSPALTFVDDQGRTVQLGSYFRGRPVVLAMGYYRCPMLCGIGINATARTLEEFPPQSSSRDFEFIFVSVNPAENYLAAAEKKSEYLRRLGWEPAAERWHFLTGGEAETAQLADQIGFRYRYDPEAKQYIHPSGLVILSPEGKISYYLLGIDYPAAELARALGNARRGEPGIAGQIISILCFSQSPVPGTVGYYVLIALRCGAVLTLGGVILLIRSKRRHPDRRYSEV